MELEKMLALTAENPCNLGVHQIIEISLVLRIAHMICKDQDKFVIYVSNYIDQNQFNQIYDSDQIEKGIKNAYIIACKLEPASKRATNIWLDVAKEKERKNEEMKERQKGKTMVAKQRRAKRGKSSSSEKEDESDIENNTDPDQAKDDYPLQL